MSESAAALIEQPLTRSADRWTLARSAGDDVWSLACTPAGWTLNIESGEFTLLAEGADDLRSRLPTLGWNESVTLRPKPDRRSGL
jgi:hypothetical protein